MADSAAKKTLIAAGRKLHAAGAAQLSLAILPLFFDFGFMSNILSIACGACAVALRAGSPDALARQANNMAITGLNISIFVFASLELIIAIIVWSVPVVGYTATGNLSWGQIWLDSAVFLISYQEQGGTTGNASADSAVQAATGAVIWVAMALLAMLISPTINIITAAICFTYYNEYDARLRALLPQQQLSTVVVVGNPGSIAAYTQGQPGNPYIVQQQQQYPPQPYPQQQYPQQQYPPQPYSPQQYTSPQFGQPQAPNPSPGSPPPVTQQQQQQQQHQPNPYAPSLGAEEWGKRR